MFADCLQKSSIAPKKVAPGEDPVPWDPFRSVSGIIRRSHCSRHHKANVLIAAWERAPANRTFGKR